MDFGVSSQKTDLLYFSVTARFCFFLPIYNDFSVQSYFVNAVMSYEIFVFIYV